MTFFDVAQNSEDWFALRLGKATNSNAGCWMANEGKAFGEPARRYALQIALEIMTGRKSGVSFSNDHTDRGHEQEPLARMLYEDETFCSVTNGGFFCHGTYGDSPDGLVDGDGVVEIKSVIAPTHYATLRRGSFDPSYLWQLVGHLDCTDRDWVDYISFCSDFPEDQQLIVHRLRREEYVDEIERLRARRSDFLGLVQTTLATLQRAA